VVYLVYPAIVAINCCQCSSEISPFLQDVKEKLRAIEKYAHSLIICSTNLRCYPRTYEMIFQGKVN